MERSNSFIPNRDLTPADWQQMHCSFTKAQRDGKALDLVTLAPSLAILFLERKAELAISDEDLVRISRDVLMRPGVHWKHSAWETVRLLRADRFSNLNSGNSHIDDLDPEFGWRAINNDARFGNAIERLSAIRAGVIAFTDREFESKEDNLARLSFIADAYSKPRPTNIPDRPAAADWGVVMDAVATAKLVILPKTDELRAIPREAWNYLYDNLDEIRVMGQEGSDYWSSISANLTSAAIISAHEITRNNQGIQLIF